MFPVGARIGTYVVEALLGKGGTSEVYLVRRDGACFALKILKEEHRQNTALQARLINEAEALQQLDVEGVVQVFDAGDEAGRPFYVMERLSDSLATRLLRPLHPSEAVSIIRHIARILSDLHARGVVHRDVKPDKITPVEKWQSFFRRPSEKVAEVLVTHWLSAKHPKRRGKQDHYARHSG